MILCFLLQSAPGERIIGGSLSWTGAGRLAPFEPASPFHGLDVPADLQVHRQVIAEPSIDIADRTWARLDDGTSSDHRRAARPRLGRLGSYDR